MNTAHHTTVELANSRLLLRTDLSFHLQEYQGEPCYLIEDELNSRFFRIGVAEYNFISLLDGTTNISAAVAQTAARMGSQALSEHDAITICKWLIDSDLASTGVSRTADRLYESYEEASMRRTMQTANPVTPKFKLFNPDRMLTTLNRIVGWLFSFPMFLVWLLVVSIALYQVWANWSSVGSGASQVFASDNWLWLGITWLALKGIHELAHGIVCKRYSGDVRTAGIVLIVLIPLPFVDVTSSWRFSSKWQRMFVAAAGMYAEVFLAAVAAIVWCACEPGVLKTQMFNIMLAGSVTTLLFNANPLMRFDGYYIMTDWLEMPNLGTHGQQFMRWIGKKFYLGMEVKKPSWPEGRGVIVASYAVLAFVWRILICVSLVLAAESLLFGLGLVLAILAFAMWVVWPLGKLLKFVFVGEETQERPGRIRFCALTGGLAVACWALFAFVPWYARVDAPAIVNYSRTAEVRMPVGGFVRSIHVRPDQMVQKGDLIATLENVELEGDIRRLQIEIETAQLKARLHKDRKEIPEWEVALKNLESLVKRLHERQDQYSNLQVRAGISGVLIADDLGNLLDSYLAPGHLLCSIGMDGHKEVHALVSQHDFEKFVDKTGKDIDVHIWGQGPGHFAARLDRVNPRARLSLPHPAFSSTAGGPLAVKYRAPSEEDASSGTDDTPFELVDPRFMAIVSIENGASSGLRAGQAGFISFRTSRGSVGEVLSENLWSWLSNMRQQINKS